MIALIWLLNFVISWVNAWGCGKSWNESRHSTGFPHFVNWCAAIMSAAGLTWCYTILLAFIGTQINTSGAHPHPYLSEASANAMMSLGYLVVIFPILGSGLVITLAMWREAYRTRSFGAGAIAGYDTFVQIYNIAHALHDVPSAFGTFTDFLSSDSESDDGGVLGKLVIALVAIAAAGGILTTYLILTVTARNVARDKAMAGAPAS